MIYSFCPDVCCPLNHVKNLNECLHSKKNPCRSEDSSEPRECKFDQEQNADFYSIVRNRWNVTCPCEDQGFAWDSR